MSKLSKLMKVMNDPKVKKAVKKGVPIIKKEIEKRKNKGK